MLERAAGLSPRALTAIAHLERRVLDADGGRLKLEWDMLRSRSGEEVEDLLWWRDDRLLGFLGAYGFGGDVELAGMVDPAARRRGIATALLGAALELPLITQAHHVLLIVPRPSVAGRTLALRRGGVLEHSEHALLLAGDPADGAEDPRVSVRRALPADGPAVSRLLQAGFGGPVAVPALDEGGERTLLVEVRGARVGTLRLTGDREAAGIYGFVIDPAWQGRGIGRDVLRRVCKQLRAEGARRIGLEVQVDNERALSLYTSIGFTKVATEDYYALPVS